MICGHIAERWGLDEVAEKVSHLEEIAEAEKLSKRNKIWYQVIVGMRIKVHGGQVAIWEGQEEVVGGRRERTKGQKCKGETVQWEVGSQV